MKYKGDLVPSTFGLANTSSLCFMNSLVQSLISCSAFNEKIIDLYKITTPESDKHKMLGALRALILRNMGSGKLDTCSDIIRVLISAYKKEATRMHNNLIYGNQECPYQGFNLMTYVVPELEKIFHVRYKNILYCGNCKNRKVADDPPDTSLRLFSEDDINEKNIMEHVEIPEGYKCEVCGHKNIQGQITIAQKYVLCRLSDIIMMVFNKYDTKKVRAFPDIMSFPSKTGIITYRVVAQIEHYGTRHGGHYTAIARRPEGVFMFNDSSITPAKLGPTPYTYMVFYHLQ